ncbi:MAG: GDP-mannose 4,6-dehydratase, partial [Candidatus Aminicenantes bacterium]|nr:GDP-mannose 4,6-dehydratase [Candidatus Aminicenantes bacterium]
IEDKPLPLYGKGTNVRDWLHVEDHCRALELVLNFGEPGTVYNIGAGNEVPNIEIAETICASLEKPHSLIRFVSDRLGHDRRYALDCHRIKELGWKPALPFSNALESTIRWYADNEGWWRRIKDKSRDYKRFYADYYRNRT